MTFHLDKIQTRVASVYVVSIIGVFVPGYLIVGLYDLMHELAIVCEESARLAGKILLDWRGQFLVREKARFDLVTEADLAAQEAIREKILASFPDHAFLGEEDTSGSEANELLQYEYCWVVDPLDGTTNYVHGFKNYCTSIALLQRGQIILGVIYAPEFGDCYTAVRGGGAYLNGEKLATSQIKHLGQALIASGFAPNVGADSVEASIFLQLLGRSQSIRRLGSAALNLCYLAAGQLDGYWALSVKPWDVAAGLLLVEEAGGVVAAPDGGPVNIQSPQLVTTSTSALQGELREVINNVLRSRESPKDSRGCEDGSLE